LLLSTSKLKVSLKLPRLLVSNPMSNPPWVVPPASPATESPVIVKPEPDSIVPIDDNKSVNA
jgi:hypothetical protein